MKKLIIFLLCIAVAGTGGFFGYKKYKQSKDDKKTVDVVPVSLMAESADMFTYFNSELQGEIVSANSQKIYVDNDKLVKKVCVKQGDTVKKGDTILEYDMTVAELELSQKENQVKVIEQNIKMANKELAAYKTYQPSENAPQPDYPDYPEEPEEPDVPDIPQEPEMPEEPEIPAEPVSTADVIKPAFSPDGGTGTKDDPYIINCNENTRVASLFMTRLCSTRKYAELWVYSGNSEFLYKWSLGADNMTVSELKDWCVSDGITMDSETGLITFDSSARTFGELSIALPSAEEDVSDEEYYPDEEYYYEEEGEEEEYVPDHGEDYGYADDLSYETSDSMDYMYSRAELQSMISEKESEIKEMEIELKGAKLEYENAKKQKSDGKVVASVDGVVKKIGTVSGEEDEEEPAEEFYEEYEEEYYGEDLYDDAFAIIEGDGGVEVRCMVSELNLDKTQVGDILGVMSWETGGYTQAEVTQIDTEPFSYEVYNWGDNPNSSTYYVHAKLYDSAYFNAGDWVSVTLNQAETTSGNSVYLPIHYVRQEGGDYYIMKAGEDDKLVKQYVKAGQILYGIYIEIKGGLSMSDRICFPYGADVKEGIKTKDSTEVLYPEEYY